MVDWPTDVDLPYSLGGQHTAYVDTNGAVVLHIRKIYRLPSPDLSTAQMALLVEADGPVRQAFWRDYTPHKSNQVTIATTMAAPGKSSWNLDEWAPNPTRAAPLGGNDTLLRPPILFDRLVTDSKYASVWAGTYFYVETSGSQTIRKWDGTEIGDTIYGTSVTSIPVWVGPTLLFAYEVNPNFGVLRWTEQDGTRILIGNPKDSSWGATSAGSDGDDLVWIQGEGRQSGESIFPKRWVMTSKFSTDPTQIKPKRLVRWDDPSIALHDPPVVGCGHAAFLSALGWPKTETVELLVVRLSDGVSWRVPSPSYPANFWMSPIAITCDEVFARHKGKGYETIRRVRLDSLGPGIPPPEL